MKHPWILGQRTVVSLVTGVSASALMAIGTGSAQAACNVSPTEVYDVMVDVGVASVAVDSTEALSTGPGERGTRVCVSPINQETDVQVSTATGAALEVNGQAGTCGAAGCTGVGATGAGTGWPTWTYFNPPADGDGTTEATVNTGTGVCPRLNGTSTGCQLGGGVNPTVSTGDGYPPPVHPAVDPIADQVVGSVYKWWIYENACTQAFFWYPWDQAAQGCAFLFASWYVWPLVDLVT